MQILTMEYVPGIKINKIQALDQLGVDRKRLIESGLLYAKSLLACYLFACVCILTTDVSIY
jgi:predicted unusual protein kinase regulating ubiquinone biosynthesis (AarF/ABC1/UbiB family)